MKEHTKHRKTQNLNHTKFFLITLNQPIFDSFYLIETFLWNEKFIWILTDSSKWAKKSHKAAASRMWDFLMPSTSTGFFRAFIKIMGEGLAIRFLGGTCTQNLNHGLMLLKDQVKYKWYFVYIWFIYDWNNVVLMKFCSLSTINCLPDVGLPYFEEQKRGHIILPMYTSNHEA